jgi:hypothetical protein
MKKVNYKLQAEQYAYFLNIAFSKSKSIKKATENDYLNLFMAENDKLNGFENTANEQLRSSKIQLTMAAEIFISNASSLIEKKLFRVFFN